jgi:hypothetical protein
MREIKFRAFEKKTKEMEDDSWKELNRAIKKIFKKGDSCSKKVGLVFYKGENPKKELSLVIYGIDNKYGTNLGTFNWEIYLNKNGTWKIN